MKVLMVSFAVLVGAAALVIILPVSTIDPQLTASAFNVVLLGIMVLVTVTYAESTSAIAKSTDKQAEATTASVKEAVKQRYLSTQPWVFPDLTQEGEYRCATDPVPVKNIGKGPAIDLKTIISNETDNVDKPRIEQIQKDFRKGALVWANSSIGPRWPYLEPGDMELLKDETLQKAHQWQMGIIAIEYKDIYAREILSGWAYRVEQGNGGRLVLIPVEPLYPVAREEKE